MVVVAPPVQPDLLGLVDRADEQPDAYREEFDFRQRDLDVAGHHEALVQDPVEHLDQPRGASVSFDDCGHKSGFYLTEYRQPSRTATASGTAVSPAVAPGLR